MLQIIKKKLMQPDVILRVTKTNEKCLEAYDFTSSESMHLFMSVRRACKLCPWSGTQGSVCFAHQSGLMPAHWGPIA